MGTPLSTAGPRERFAEYRSRSRALANLIGKNHPTRMSALELGELIGITGGQMTGLSTVLQYIGALKVTSIAAGPTGGRTNVYELLMDGQELDHALHLEMERQMRGGISPNSIRQKIAAAQRHPVTRQSAEEVAVQEDRFQEPVGAVVGPEAPKPLAEGLRSVSSDALQALVLAAKQYARTGGRTPEADKATALMAQLGELGIMVPDELVAKARVVPDERLEHIGLVLPYIEALERQVAGLGQQLREMNDYGELKQYRERHKREHEAMVASGVAAAMREQARR